MYKHKEQNQLHTAYLKSYIFFFFIKALLACIILQENIDVNLMLLNGKLRFLIWNHSDEKISFANKINF